MPCFFNLWKRRVKGKEWSSKLNSNKLSISKLNIKQAKCNKYTKNPKPGAISYIKPMSYFFSKC